jgi:hypothetical protein
MKPAQHGDRVGAFTSADQQVVYFLGYGTYEEDEFVEYLDDFTFEQAEEKGQEMLKAMGLSDWPDEMDTPATRLAKFEEFKQSPMYRIPRTHPKIKLDNGDVVYGNECHFGPAAAVEKLVAGRRVQLVAFIRDEKGEPEEHMAGRA